MLNTPTPYSLSHLPHPFVVMAKTGKIIEANTAFQSLIRHPENLPLTGLAAKFANVWEDSKTMRQELELNSSWYQVDAFLLNEEHAGFIFIDIQKWVKETESAKAKARIDALTSLPNRTAFLERYHQLIQQDSKPTLSIVMIDLNHFKTINDTYGHNLGDDVLRFVAQRLKGALRQTDLLARWGGDEFIALVQNRNENFSEVICRRFSERLTMPFVKGNVKIDLSASIGCAHVLAKDVSLTKVIEQADAAMYSNKEHFKRSDRVSIN